MQTFASPFSVKLKLIGVMAAYVGFPCYFFLLPLLSGRLRWGDAVILGVFLLPVIYSLIGLIDASSVYEMDEDGITKRGLRGETRLRWRELSGYELSSTKHVLTLTDTNGQQMNVVLDSHVTHYRFRDASGMLLADALNQRLAPLTAQMQRQAVQGQTFRYGLRSPAGLLGIAMPIVSLLMAAFIRFAPMLKTTSPSDNNASLGLSGFFVFGALFLLAGGLPLLLSVYTVTDTDISLRLPWRTVTIPFAHLHVFAAQTVGKNKDMERVTLQGDGKTIAFNSTLPNYALLLEFVRARVPAETLNAQPSAKAEMERRDARSMAWQMPIVGLILAFLLGLMGLLFTQTGQEKLEHYRLLAAQGKTTIARVTDTQVKGRSDPRYRVDYTLDVGGKSYEGSGYVPLRDYEQARSTGNIPVVYLPSNPDIKHAMASLGKAQGEEMIRVGHIMFGIAACLPFLLGLGAAIAYHRKYTSSAVMRRLERMQSP